MTSEEQIGRFDDKHGRHWSIDLSVGLCRQVLKETGVDLANYHNGKAAQTLWADDTKLVEVLWVLVEEDATKADIGPEEFAKSLNGDVLAKALEAIEVAVLGFTRPDRRELIRQIADKAKTVQIRVVEEAKAKLASSKTDALIERALVRESEKIDKQLEKQLTSGT